MCTVSIIIPVYKAKEYLADCMESIFAQTWPEIEIILVDDGSPDGSGELCDHYAASHHNVRVIHQENSGPGASRNAGMDTAAGEYLMFADADDRLDSTDSVRLLVQKAEETEADIVQGCFRRFHDDWISEINRHHLDGLDPLATEFRFRGFYQYGHLAYNWGKLYRKSFLDEHQLRQGQYPFTMDKAHNLAIYAWRPKYALINESVYMYRVNEASITFRYKEELIPVWISIATDFRDYVKQHHLKGDFGDLIALHVFFGSFFIVKQELLTEGHGIRGAVKALKEYHRYPVVKWSMRSLSNGRYIKDIEAVTWRILIRGASMVYDCHLYSLFAIGIAALQKLSVDKTITRRRYQ